MRLFITTLVLLFAFEAFAEDGLKATQYKYVKESIGKGKPYFLEIGADSCRSCKIMSKMLYKATQEHPQYNIHYINVKKERKVARDLSVRMIPTQIIYNKDGEEVYRHIGLLSSDELSDLFKTYLF